MRGLPIGESIRRGSALVAVIVVVVLSSGGDWRQFRGDDSRSVAVNDYLPSTLTEGEIAWTVDLPGQGVSCPIIVGGRVIVTASSGPKEERLHVLCYSAETGELLWERAFWATGRTLCHPSSAVAAPTPASDGQRIFAFYSSNDLFCLDLDGNVLWARGLTYDYPTAANDTGMASSPVVVGDVVVALLGSQGESFGIALDAQTGETRWRVDRESIANWASPVALNSPGANGDNPAVLLQSPQQLTVHDARTGELRFKHEAPCDSIPSATIVDDLIYLPSEGLTVLELNGSQELEVRWKDNRLASSTSSPIVTDGRIYTINSAGVLTCADAASGESLWKLRLKGSFWATPVVAGKHLYCVNQDGLAQVVDLSDKGEVVSTYDFGEMIMASPAVADGGLYFRSDDHLWKIARP